MKRQSLPSNTTTRVYSYGTVPSRIAPVLSEDLALHQLWLANRLWNVLVTIERNRVSGYRRIMYNPDQSRLDELGGQIESLRDEIRQARKTAHSRVVDMGDRPMRIKSLNQE